ncbi:MAG: hypothetical protein K6E38_08040 [Fretibacterium sp.]|nr:hypothetical protein [Fretibacterium sp.]
MTEGSGGSAHPLSSIEVYAFVGPAGTGKSHRATHVARQYGVDLIIDDGLVVSRGRIMAGRSAKSELNRLRAIRRAIFEYAPHREDVVNYLISRAPCRLMVLATSEGMAMKITRRLGLNDPVKVIQITDVSSPEEIQAALRERREKRQHVVPVARAQIQRNFAGKLVRQIKGFFKSREPEEGEGRNTIVTPPFSFDGRVTIGTDALLAMCRRLLELGDHVQKIHELELVTEEGHGLFPSDDSLVVNVVLDLRLGEMSALAIARRLQQKIRAGLSYFTGMDVRKVNIRVLEVTL